MKLLSSSGCRKYFSYQEALKWQIWLPQQGKRQKLYARKTSAWFERSASLAPWFSASTASAYLLGPDPIFVGCRCMAREQHHRCLTVAMILCLFHAYTYSVIGATMPRSAADYTMASRTLSAPLAFAASWTLVIFSAMVAGSLIAWIPRRLSRSCSARWG